MKRRLVGASLVVLVALGSTVHAVRREAAATERASLSALDAVELTVIPPSQVGTIPFVATTDRPFYGVSLLNSGTTAVVVREASWWDGLTTRVDRGLEPGSTTYLLLPRPTCPATRVTEPVKDVVVEVETTGGTRSLTLPIPAEITAHEEINTACGLFRAYESLQGGTSVIRSRPGEVVLDVAVGFSGSRPTKLLAVRGAEGVEATVTESLPLATTLVQDTRVYRPLPHTFTVRLRLVDCAPVEASEGVVRDFVEGTVPDPVWSEIGLEVQRAGDVVERVNLGFLYDAANALVDSCDVAPLQSEGD